MALLLKRPRPGHHPRHRGRPGTTPPRGWRPTWRRTAQWSARRWSPMRPQRGSTPTRCIWRDTIWVCGWSGCRGGVPAWCGRERDSVRSKSPRWEPSDSTDLLILVGEPVGIGGDEPPFQRHAVHWGERHVFVLEPNLVGSTQQGCPSVQRSFQRSTTTRTTRLGQGFLLR